jgi:hypothetical protein
MLAGRRNLMIRMRVVAAAIFCSVSATHAAEPEDTGKRAGKFVEKTATRAGKFVERTATRAGKFVERTAKKAEKGLKKLGE